MRPSRNPIGLKVTLSSVPQPWAELMIFLIMQVFHWSQPYSRPNDSTQNRLRMLTVPRSEAENSNVLKLWWDSQGNGRFATDSQGHLQMSDGDPRTVPFSPNVVTAGDTACSVNGV